MYQRLVAVGGRGVRVRRLGGNRAGEMRITRFLRNDAVSVEEILASVAAQTADRVAGRHILAIQDTSDVRRKGYKSIAVHPTIAVDADTGALLGLVHADFLARRGGRRGTRNRRAFEDKESRRWLDGAVHAGRLLDAGAAAVTVVADREADIYRTFADRPAGVDMVIRARHDRSLKDGGRLYAAVAGCPALGRMTVDLPSAPGRPKRSATLELRARLVTITEPCHSRKPARTKTPRTLDLWLLDALEIDPPAGQTAAHWRLLSTHPVASLADGCRIVGYYRQRWTIEQLFRTLKTRGFDIEMLRIADGGPFEKLVAASLAAAVTVLALVRERDGVERRPLGDVLDAADRPVLEAVSRGLEGKTAKQKNPHPKGSLAYATWVFARLGGWTGYYGKPGPVVILSGLIQFQTMQQGWALHDV